MQMLRFLIALPLGLFVMFAVISSVEFLAHQIAPPSEEMKAAVQLHLQGDPGAAEALRTALPTVSWISHAGVVLAWIVGAVGGTFASCRMSGRFETVFGVAIGLLVALAAAANLLILPHPAWMWPAGLALPLAAAVAMGRWMENTRPEAPRPRGR